MVTDSEDTEVDLRMNLWAHPNTAAGILFPLSFRRLLQCLHFLEGKTGKEPNPVGSLWDFSAPMHTKRLARAHPPPCGLRVTPLSGPQFALL